MPVEFEPLSRIVSTSLIWPRLGVLLMVTFGVTALVLAATGVFGVIAFVAAQRSGEMAVRLALGATSGHVFRMIVRHGGSLALQGLVLGVLLAWWMGGLMGRYVYEVSPGELAGARRQRRRRAGRGARRDASVGAPGGDHAARTSAQALTPAGDGASPASGHRCSIATAVATLFIASVARMMTLRPASLSSTTTSKSSRRESGMPSFG